MHQNDRLSEGVLVALLANVHNVLHVTHVTSSSQFDLMPAIHYHRHQLKVNQIKITQLLLMKSRKRSEMLLNVY